MLRAAAGCALLAFATWVAAYRSEPVRRLDGDLLSWFLAVDDATPIDLAVRPIVKGTAYVYPLLCVALLWWAWRRRGRGAALAAGAGVLLANALAQGLQWLTFVPRPHHELVMDRVAWPSGHAAAVTVLAATVALLAPGRRAVAAAAAVAAGYALALLVIHWHYPSDVIGGVALGAGAALAARRLHGARLAWDGCSSPPPASSPPPPSGPGRSASRRSTTSTPRS